MNQLIACCGLDCEFCDARIATLTNNNALREKTAALWTKLNGVTITPEMINCTGCRVDGAKTPFCDKLCSVHNCVREKRLDTCADCAQIRSFILPGGNISEIDSLEVKPYLQALKKREILIAGICAGVDVLDHAGILRDVKSIHSSDVDFLVTLSKSTVVRRLLWIYGKNFILEMYLACGNNPCGEKEEDRDASG